MIGYVDFYAASGKGKANADHFLTFARASEAGIPYSNAKPLLHVSQHQAETKKAAFQEYGLLYVTPRSDRLELTPLGRFVYRTLRNAATAKAQEWVVLFALARGLSRYQFQNPFGPAGTPRSPTLGHSDVRPYLAAYYLLTHLDGYLTESELRGAVFGLDRMQDVVALRDTIQSHRDSGTVFPPLPYLPSNPRTADNLRIYFVSHLGLENRIISREETDVYGSPEPAYTLVSVEGEEIVRSVLQDQWPDWAIPRPRAPAATAFVSVEDYFRNGVGSWTGFKLVESVREGIESAPKIVSEEDLQSLAGLPHREYVDGERKLIRHSKMEKPVTIRNRTLIKDAKAQFKAAHKGRLFCEACRIDFSRKYGRRGQGYIEAHHRVPLSRLTGPRRLTVADLAMLCSNCHRMIHIKPWLTVEEFRRSLHRES